MGLTPVLARELAPCREDEDFTGVLSCVSGRPGLLLMRLLIPVVEGPGFREQGLKTVKSVEEKLKPGLLSSWYGISRFENDGSGGKRRGRPSWCCSGAAGSL